MSLLDIGYAQNLSSIIAAATAAATAATAKQYAASVGSDHTSTRGTGKVSATTLDLSEKSLILGHLVLRLTCHR